jgi:hypothetical protein
LAFACALGVSPSSSEARKAKAAPQQQAAEPAHPSEASEEADEKKQAAAAARQAYDAGLKAFANGKYQPAVDQLSLAVKGAGLTSPEMAKALYTRGASYKKLNKPGLAISDLTSALWLKNGLSGADRQTATAERAEAYKMAGLQETGDASERVIVENSTPATPAAAASTSGPNASSAGLSAAAVAQAAAAQARSGDASGASVTRQDASSDSAQDAARARAAYKTANADGLQAAASAGVIGTPGSSAAPAQPAGSTALALTSTAEAAPGPVGLSSAPAAPASNSVTSSVSGFFSNIFGGGPAAAPQQTESVTTASMGHEPETSSWSSSTIVTDGNAKASAARPSPSVKRHTATAAVAPEAAAPAKVGGKYKVHVAALRSRADAEALAQKLIAQHGADLDNHVPTVDEAVIGSMGTFYRVRINGYASQDEPRSLCNKLRTSGLDCLVVTN